MTEQDKLLRWFYLALLSLIWGSSFILMKRGLQSFSPDQVAATRMLVSFLSLFPFVIYRIKKIEKKYFKYIFTIGLLGNGIPAFLFTHAQTHIASAMAGMLNSLTPVFVVIVGSLFFGSVFKASHIFGVIIGLAGAVALILINSKGKITGTDNAYGLLIVVATISYAFSVTIMRRFLQTLDAVLITGFALFITGIPSGIFLFTTDFTQRLQTVPGAWTNLFYVILLGLFGTAVSTILFYKLVKISNALYASSVTYIIPIVALLWGIFDGETLGIHHFLAMSGILFGVYLINLQSIREQKSISKHLKP
ncbi:MAG: EamA family transporter [Bacteroidota bacterium]